MVEGFCFSETRFARRLLLSFSATCSWTCPSMPVDDHFRIPNTKVAPSSAMTVLLIVNNARTTERTTKRIIVAADKSDPWLLLWGFKMVGWRIYDNCSFFLRRLSGSITSFLCDVMLHHDRERKDHVMPYSWKGEKESQINLFGWIKECADWMRWQTEWPLALNKCFLVRVIASDSITMCSSPCPMKRLNAASLNRLVLRD